jgi:glucose-6-phosphate isomerase
MVTAESTSKKQCTSTFSKYKATAKLKDLAQTPFDLTKKGNLNPERIASYCSRGCGYQLLYGTERINDEVIQSLKELAAEAKALDQMKQMQAGEIVNVIHGYASDNRGVLHTAMRDFFDEPNQAPAAKEATKKALQEQNKLKAFLKEIDSKFTDLVTIGIGGSDLGPKATYLSLPNLHKSDKRVHFVSNLDPDEVVRVIKGLDLKKTLVAVISKSGTTLETVANENFMRDRFKKAGLKPQEHFISVSAQGSAIDNPKEYLKCFYGWDYVGGRFCTTAMFGGVTLAFGLGYDNYWEFLKGANSMDKLALKDDLKTNLPLLLALIGIWNRSFLHYPTVALVPYSQALWRFSAHIQQVDMESNGKHIDKQGHRVDFHTGPIVWGEPGTSAQHSFFQMIHQGTDIVPLEFIGFRKSQYEDDYDFQGTTNQEKLLANLFAQAIALAEGQKNDNPNKVFEGNRPSCILLGDRLTPFAMGALFALYEHKIAFQGFIWDINSFDQEGVQLGKQLATKVLHQFEARKGKAIDSSFPLGEAYLKQLDSIKKE